VAYADVLTPSYSTIDSLADVVSDWMAIGGTLWGDTLKFNADTSYITASNIYSQNNWDITGDTVIINGNLRVTKVDQVSSADTVLVYSNDSIKKILFATLSPKDSSFVTTYTDTIESYLTNDLVLNTSVTIDSALTLNGNTTANGWLLFNDPGTTANSFVTQWQADSGGTVQTSSWQTIYGANPYIEIKAPDNTGTATSILKVYDNLLNVVGNLTVDTALTLPNLTDTKQAKQLFIDGSGVVYTGDTANQTTIARVIALQDSLDVRYTKTEADAAIAASADSSYVVANLDTIKSYLTNDVVINSSLTVDSSITFGVANQKIQFASDVNTSIQEEAGNTLRLNGKTFITASIGGTTEWILSNLAFYPNANLGSDLGLSSRMWDDIWCDDLNFLGSSVANIAHARATSGAGNNTLLQAGGAQSGGTDLAGGDLILSGGLNTGDGAGGDVLIKNYTPGAAGTSDGSQRTNVTFTEFGGVAYTPSADSSIVAGTGITAKMLFRILRVAGSGGAVDISANPQIADGIDGQIIMIQGTSDVNTVQFDDGTGLALSGGVSFTMGQGDILQLMYDSGDDIWYEISRSDN
jgi:hypothetical protein